MKYTVDIVVGGFFNWTGEAPNKEIARELALQACSEADFGPLEDVDFDIHSTETEW